MSTIIRGNLLLVIWGLVAFVWIQLIWASLNWLTDYFVVTNSRLLLISGALSRSVIITPLTAIHDLSFYRPLSGRLLGYGTFVVERAEQGPSVIEYLPYPEQLYLEICGIIFAGSSDGGVENED
jgi:Bacterial PH domain